MSIQTKDELLAQFPDNAIGGQPNEITAEKIRSLIESLDVGATLYGAGDQPITPSVQPFTAYDSATRSSGAVVNLNDGTITVGAGAAGYYAVVFVCTMTIAASGQIRLRLRKNGINTPFNTGAIDVENGKAQQFVLLGSGNLETGDVIDVAIQGNGSITADVESCQFQITR